MSFICSLFSSAYVMQLKRCLNSDAGIKSPRVAHGCFQIIGAVKSCRYGFEYYRSFAVWKRLGDYAAKPFAGGALR
jgi:hypothetical protein